MKPFGKRVLVQNMQGRPGTDAAAWNTVREWTGPKAVVTQAMRDTVARLTKES